MPKTFGTPCTLKFRLASTVVDQTMKNFQYQDQYWELPKNIQVPEAIDLVSQEICRGQSFNQFIILCTSECYVKHNIAVAQGDDRDDHTVFQVYCHLQSFNFKH